MSASVEGNIHFFLRSSLNCYKEDYRKFVEIFLRGVEGDKRGLASIDLALVERLTHAIRTLRGMRDDTLQEMRAFVEEYGGYYRHLYLVDCLGLPDLYAVLHAASRRGFSANVKVFINAKGTTARFKDAFRGGTMREVATTLKGLLIRRPDERLHALSGLYSREELARALVDRMMYVGTLIPLEGATIVLSDHGYDVISKDNLYIIQHGFAEKPALAKIAPLLLIKR